MKNLCCQKTQMMSYRNGSRFKMPKIHINVKNDFINVISSHGVEVEVDVETLARWNDAISKWWEVQLEMDKAVKSND